MTRTTLLLVMISSTSAGSFLLSYFARYRAFSELWFKKIIFKMSSNFGISSYDNMWLFGLVKTISVSLILTETQKLGKVNPSYTVIVS